MAINMVRTPLSQEKRAMIKALRAKKLSYREIAIKIGCSLTTVRNVLIGAPRYERKPKVIRPAIAEPRNKSPFDKPGWHTRDKFLTYHWEGTHVVGSKTPLLADSGFIKPPTREQLMGGGRRVVYYPLTKD